MKYNLVGQDGNAFALMAYTSKAMKEQGFSKGDINHVIEDAMASNYNNLIFVLDCAIQKCNLRADGMMPDYCECCGAELNKYADCIDGAWHCEDCAYEAVNG